MNRIILIGNGFDLAHGLKTRYSDFINQFWKDQVEAAKDFSKWKGSKGGYFIFENDFFMLKTNPYKEIENTEELKQSISNYKNTFLERIEKARVIVNWVDLEELYYRELLNYLEIEKNNNDAFVVSPICKLNEDFGCIKDELENYLKKHIIIDKSIFEREIYNNIWDGYQNDEEVLFLNFNYTDTDKLYKNRKVKADKQETVHIHGMLGKENNPIIFGYGDELAKDFSTIENINRNEFLENAKSIKYLETDNYDTLLTFMEKGKYKVLIFGHSCGNSDRTLLNTIFEDPFCSNIKPFYYRENALKDNFSEMTRNISRSFAKDKDSKAHLRKFVEKKEKCKPLLYGSKIKRELEKFINDHFVLVNNQFYLGKTQVTQELYMQIMECDNPSYFKGLKYPVEQISWFNAVKFCNKLSERYGIEPYYKIVKKEKEEEVTPILSSKGFRLSTKDEWEYAATSAGKYKADENGYEIVIGNDIKEKQYLFARNKNTNDINDLGWWWDNSEQKTHPVGEKQPNDIGLFDMSGNVWEWCEDLYDNDNSRDRVLRGGSWDDGAEYCRVSYRNYYEPGNRGGIIGFRLARSL